VPGDGLKAQPAARPQISERTEGRGQEGRRPSSGGRCGSCGAPTDDGDLCRSCQQAFGALLGSARPASQSVAPATARPQAPRVDESLWSQLMNTPAPPPMDSFDALAAAAPPPPPPAPPAPAAVPPVDVRAVAAQLAAVKPPEIKLEPIRVEPVRANAATPVEAVKTPALARPHAVAPPQAVMREAYPAKAPRPASGSPRPNASMSPERKRQYAVGAAALAFLAAMGAGGAWLRSHEQHQRMIAEQELQAQIAQQVSVAEPEPAPAPVAAAPPSEPPAVKPRKPVAAPKQRPTSARSKPAVPAPPQIGSASLAQVPGASPAPVLPPAAQVVAVSAPASAAPEQPLGPFFQTTEVNEAPRVERRVPPQLPAELRGRKINEIVVVRALVSHAGRPSRISLLRRSRTGPELDDAIMAAVNRWTFAPAKKRGEAVSCWFNFAVAVGQPN
jgi:TonB family protein